MSLFPQGSEGIELCGNAWANNPSALPCPLPGSLSHTAPSHPPKPKDAGYLALGCLATAMPGGGVGVWPEAALIREWRDGGRRFQGDVGFGEGWPRWARFLRQREARALGGRRAATVRAEERVSRSQIVLSSELCPRTGHCTPPCPGRAPDPLAALCLAYRPSLQSSSCPPFYTALQYCKAPSHITGMLGRPHSVSLPPLSLLPAHSIWPHAIQMHHGPIKFYPVFLWSTRV